MSRKDKTDRPHDISVKITWPKIVGVSYKSIETVCAAYALADCVRKFFEEVMPESQMEIYRNLPSEADRMNVVRNAILALGTDMFMLGLGIADAKAKRRAKKVMENFVNQGKKDIQDEPAAKAKAKTKKVVCKRRTVR